MAIIINMSTKLSTLESVVGDHDNYFFYLAKQSSLILPKCELLGTTTNNNTALDVTNLEAAVCVYAIIYSI
jgi:hypothetical protein